METSLDTRRRILELIPRLREVGIHISTSDMGVLDPWLRGQSATEETLIDVINELLDMIENEEIDSDENGWCPNLIRTPPENEEIDSDS